MRISPNASIAAYQARSTLCVALAAAVARSAGLAAIVPEHEVWLPGETAVGLASRGYGKLADNDATQRTGRLNPL